jgi:hypothetical protein
LQLKYADVLVNAPFKSDEAALRALENAEMISISHRDGPSSVLPLAPGHPNLTSAHPHPGRPSVIRPGKPVYRSAFQTLLADDVFRASIEFQINSSATATATSELHAAEKSLFELSQLFGSGNGKWVFGGGSTVPREIELRVGALLAKMRDAEDKLDRLEKQKVELLKVLAEAS